MLRNSSIDQISVLRWPHALQRSSVIWLRRRCRIMTGDECLALMGYNVASGDLNMTDIQKKRIAGNMYSDPILKDALFLRYGSPPDGVSALWASFKENYVFFCSPAQYTESPKSSTFPSATTSRDSRCKSFAKEGVLSSLCGHELVYVSASEATNWPCTSC